MTAGSESPKHVAWAIVGAIACLRIALYAVSNLFFPYGYTPDELYFLDCAARLDWGYVDHPPLSIAWLRLVHEVLGDSLPAVRLTPALAGAFAVLLTGLIARELGGGRAAQGLAALAMLVSPTVLWVGSYYSMNSIDLVVWPAASYLFLRLAHGADARLWIPLGFCLGLGLMNKASALWLGCGLAAALLLTGQRRWLVTRWPWLAAAIAASLFAPNLIWQTRHAWPTIEFMRHGMSEVMLAKGPLTFLREQVQSLQPLGALMALAGIATLVGSRAHRPLAFLFSTVLAILIASGSARPYYLTPAYPIVLSAGGAAIERAARRRALGWLPALSALLLALAGIVTAPLVIPLMPAQRLLAYQQWIGFDPPQTEFESAAMPVHFALQFGWPELAQAVADAYSALPDGDRAHAAILATTFGESGALDFYGSALGLPPALGTHNNYWLWGIGSATGEVMVIVAAPGAALLNDFESVEAAGQVRCEHCLPFLGKRVVYVARRPRQPLADLWPKWRDFS